MSKPTPVLSILRAMAVVLTACNLHACRGDSSESEHPLAPLALAAAEAPPPCALEKDAQPMFMLPGDPAWGRDLKMTVEWWTGSDPVQEELDAALSHMLRPKGEERRDRPAVVILAMRFKDQVIAEEMKLRIQNRLRRPDVRITREKRIVLLQAPTARLPKDCANALWDEEVSRLRRIAD